MYLIMKSKGRQNDGEPRRATGTARDTLSPASYCNHSTETSQARQANWIQPKNETTKNNGYGFFRRRMISSIRERCTAVFLLINSTV